jgi:hypothetical protein
MLKIINVYSEYNYYHRKIFSLLKRTKSILFFLIVSFLLFYSFEKKYFKTNNNINESRVCICTLGKNENRYIKEFLNHYKELGVDKIFLYDNNDKGNNSESFENEISEFIKEDFVEIINYRGKVHPQFQIYRKCYQKYNQIYDWLIFFDIDELIHLENYSNIKDFLNEKRFNKCKLIYFNCFRHTDNDLLYYDNRSLEARFPFINWKSNLFTLKTIARGNITKIRFLTSHWLDRRISGCNVFGKVEIPTRKVNLNIDINKDEYKKYYIDHYCFKSTEEYINKINKGDGIFGYNNKIKMHKINLYFYYNKISVEKINYLESKTGLNLSSFRRRLNDSNTYLKKT